MKFIKKCLLFLLIVLIFTSGGYQNISRGIDKTVTTFSKIYSSIEDFAVKMSEVTEIQYEEYYLTEPEFDSALKSLNSRQQELYKILYAISCEMPQGFIKLYKKYDGIKRDISVAYSALLYDRVDIFWMPYSYILTDYYDGKDTYTAISFSYSGKIGDVDYNIEKSLRQEMQEELEEKTNRIMAQSDKLSSEYDKEKFFNDYICENTEYVKDGELVSTVYGALINGKAHCEGYSRAFKYLCNLAGIECDLVCGDSFGEGHMWNVVNIDGAHNYVDVTWNDRAQYKSYLYFNITSEQISYDHEFYPLHSEASDEDITNGEYNFVIRESTYTGNTYYEKNGLVLNLTYVESAAEKIMERYRSSEKYTEFLFRSEHTLAEFKKDELKFISGIQQYLDNVIIDSYIFDRDVLTLFCK